MKPGTYSHNNWKYVVTEDGAVQVTDAKGSTLKFDKDTYATESILENLKDIKPDGEEEAAATETKPAEQKPLRKENIDVLVKNVLRSQLEKAGK